MTAELCLGSKTSDKVLQLLWKLCAIKHEIIMPSSLNFNVHMAPKFYWQLRTSGSAHRCESKYYHIKKNIVPARALSNSTSYCRNLCSSSFLWRSAPSLCCLSLCSSILAEMFHNVKVTTRSKLNRHKLHGKTKITIRKQKKLELKILVNLFQCFSLWNELGCLKKIKNSCMSFAKGFC